MSLNKQVHLYSVSTDEFYTEEENYIHTRLLKLYRARQNKAIENWRKKSINRIIKKEKAKLTKLLDFHLEEKETRTLKQDGISDKNIISLFESSLTRALRLKTNELTDEIIILNVFFFQVFEDLVKNGFYYKDNKYVFLTASAGQIRQKRAVFIKEDSYKKISGRLMCGLTIDDINDAGGINTNKFLAYLALNSSATEVWEDFDIDKAIVVEDFETDVVGEVDYIDSKYNITRQKTPVSIPHMDGCGIMLDDKTRMVRLPWIKGLLVTFKFDEFIKEKCPNGKAIVKDIYGKSHDILGEGIRYIFTKSQFKLWKYYDDFEDYKNKFKENCCEACYCNEEEDCIPNSRINYQMLQTLSDMKDEEIDKLIQPTVQEIEMIGNDYRTTMRLLGATEYNKNPSYFQQALIIYPELFRDQYCREILKETKKSLIKQAKGGRLRVNGKYFFLSPDLYAFCEWLFLGDENPKGLLEDKEVYIKEFKDKDELACLRSPHLYREWPIRINKRNEELDRWFGVTKCIYTSCHDLITRYVMADCDGDKLLVIKDNLLTRIAKRNMNDIVPLAYELEKAKPEILSLDSMYEGMIHAYTGGNIGPISNNITKVWNSENIGQEQIDVVKRLCFINNQIIDYAKTLWKVDPPKEINETIRKYTKVKVPDFFQYAKDKSESQVELPNNSTMNRIAAKIPDPKLKFSKAISKFDYRMLMNLDCDFSISSENQVIKSYDYWNARQSMFNEMDENKKDQDLYKFQKMRERIIEESGKDLDYIVNTLVAFLYTQRPTSAKKSLWACFGDIILENIKRNLEGKGQICPICGKRFEPIKSNQVYCSDDCFRIYRREYKRNNMRKLRANKTNVDIDKTLETIVLQ